MDNGRCHDGESWAHIMLQHSLKIKTMDDQKDFWQWVLDPSEEGELEMQFEEYDPEAIKLTESYTAKSQDEEKECDQEFDNTIKRMGFTTYIQSKPGNQLID